MIVDEHINGDGNPDLSFYGVFAGAEQGFGAKVLLGPLEGSQTA